MADSCLYHNTLSCCILIHYFTANFTDDPLFPFISLSFWPFFDVLQLRNPTLGPSRTRGRKGGWSGRGQALVLPPPPGWGGEGDLRPLPPPLPLRLNLVTAPPELAPG